MLVATPIGNLGDLSPRAVEALRDGRRHRLRGHPPHPRSCCTHAGIPARRRLVAVHDHNEAGAGPRRSLARLDARRAGGGGHRRRHARHLRSRRAAGARPPPRPATRSRWSRGRRPRSPRWSSAGCRPAGSCFEGFLPRKGSARPSASRSSAAERRTIVLFEAPHRVRRTLADLAAALRRRRAGWRSPGS